MVYFYGPTPDLVPLCPYSSEVSGLVGRFGTVWALATEGVPWWFVGPSMGSVQTQNNAQVY